MLRSHRCRSSRFCLTFLLAAAGPGFLQHRYILLVFARLSSFLLLFLSFSVMLEANFRVTLKEQ